MKFMSKAAFALAAFCSASSPAWADDQLFGFSAPTGVTLTLNGTTVLNAINTGWYRNDGTHNAGNSNYIVGNVGAVSFNNFFVFDLSGISDTITSAVFSAPRFTSTYGSGSNLTYSLHSVLTPISMVTASQSGAAGQSIFNDLGTGRVFGSQVFAANDYTSATALSFNSGGLYYLNAARGSNFAVGGAIAAVPEPATWGMMFMGLGLVGGAMRYRRRSTQAAYA